MKVTSQNQLSLRFTITALVLSIGIGLTAQDSHAQRKKKVIKYRQHTEINFSGEAVQGKIRTPEVFYIFQRKRSTNYRVVHAPTNFSDHGESTLKALDESLGREPAPSGGSQ